MASGSQRQYNATFAIGAKLLGSFKGVMAQAQSRLQRLNASALKMGSAFKKMALGLTALGGVLAGFGIAKVFSSIFEGSEAEAAEAEQRATRLAILLMQHNQIRLKGLGFAQKQTELIFKANEALAHQGVIGKEVLNATSAQLAVFGYAPKQMASMIKPMMDVLVEMRGINATQEDAVGLATAWGRAVVTGMVKPMRQFGFFADQKAWKKMNLDERNKALLKFADGYAKLGVNAKAANTDLGKIRIYHNEISEIAEEIHRQMLPAQAEMASAWLDALPEIKPIMVAGFKAIIRGAVGLVGVIKTKLVPAWRDFQKLMDGSLGAAFARLKANWMAMTGKLGPEFVKLFERLGAKGRDFQTVVGNVLIGALDRLGAAFKLIGDNAGWLVPLVASLTAGFVALDVAMGVAALINPFSLAAIAIGAATFGIIQLNQHLDELRARQDAIGAVSRGLKAFDDWLQPFVARFRSNFMQAWVDLAANLKSFDDWLRPFVDLFAQNFVQAWVDLWTNLGKVKDALGPVMSGMQELGRVIGDALLAPIHNVMDAWSGLMTAFQNRPTWMGGAPKPPSAPIPAQVPGMATGGIIRGHSLLQVAERGPEAIIPLSGGRRAEDLLNYASRAMGVGGTTNNREMNVTFAPQITIHGNATETEQRALESRQRKLQSEFIAGIKAATQQERRLSFDSAYS